MEPLVQGWRSGKKDIWNGAAAGCAAGSVVGLRTGSVLGSAGACAAFASMSALVESIGLGQTSSPTEARRKAVYGIAADDK